MRTYSKDHKNINLLYLVVLLSVIIIVGCTRKESDQHKAGFLYTWIKSYQYNSSTGLFDTIRPSLSEDSIFILDTGYITFYKGSLIQFRSEVLDKEDFESYNTGTCYHDYIWSAFHLEDGTSMIYTTAINEPLLEVRFGKIENEHYMEFDCYRIDLYNWELIYF
jgi:hypothetical protein